MKRVFFLVMIAACADERADVEPLGDYTTWLRIDTWGHAPGHGDTYRIIWANDIALTAQSPAEGTILVKEVYNRDADGSPGSLQVIEIGRKVGPASADWLFTSTPTRNGDEVVKDFCWRRCHQAAPYAGAWFDYTKF